MKKTSTLKKTGVILLSVGMILGIAQTFFYHNATIIHRDKIEKSETSDEGVSIGCQALTPGCGVCLHKIENGYCVEYRKKHARGFPLFTTGSGVNYKTNQPLGLEHLLNTLLFFTPGVVVLIVEKRTRHENNKNTARS